MRLERGFRRITMVVSLVLLTASLAFAGWQVYRVADSQEQSRRAAAIAEYRQTHPGGKSLDELFPYLRQPERVIYPAWFYWNPITIAMIGLAMSSILAAIPWGIFYLVRWISRGFSN